jgi:hypothetical protein
MRVRHGFVETVEPIVVGLHGNAVFDHALVISGTRQRHHEKEADLIGLHLPDQSANVAPDASLGIVGKSDYIADDGCDPRVVPCPNAGTVFLHPILSLACGLEIPRIEALHANEDGTAAGADRLIDEAGDLMGRDVRLDDELDRNAFLAQGDESVEGLFPGRAATIEGEPKRESFRQMPMTETIYRALVWKLMERETGAKALAGC